MTKAVTNFRWRLIAFAMPVIALLAAPGAASAIEINEDFKPQNEFKLDPWVDIDIFGIDMSINKAVFWFLAGARPASLSSSLRPHATTARPGKIQAAIEPLRLAANKVTNRNIDKKIAAKLVPVPRNDLPLHLVLERCSASSRCRSTLSTRVALFGLERSDFRALRRYRKRLGSAGTGADRLARLQNEGIKAKGAVGYVKGWVPSGTNRRTDPDPSCFPVEALSQFVQPRLADRPTLRQHARRPHAHPDHGRRNDRSARSRTSLGHHLAVGVFFYFFEVLLVDHVAGIHFHHSLSHLIGGAVAQEH